MPTFFYEFLTGEMTSEQIAMLGGYKMVMQIDKIYSTRKRDKLVKSYSAFHVPSVKNYQERVRFMDKGYTLGNTSLWQAARYSPHSNKDIGQYDFIYAKRKPHKCVRFEFIKYLFGEMGVEVYL